MALTAPSPLSRPTPPQAPRLAAVGVESRPRGRSAARQWFGGVVKVFERDPALLEGLDAESAAVALAQGVAPTLMLDTGQWTPPSGERCDRILALLVLDGFLLRCIKVDGVTCPELLGPGDVLRPWDHPIEQEELGVTSSWKVLSPVTLAVLDTRFIEVTRRWPRISQALMTRSLQRSRSMAFRTAIAQVRRADDRLRMLFRDLAARWGKVTPEGIVVPLPLTNQLIAQLASLRRPTASSTMTRLGADGEIVRRPGTGFVVNLEWPADDAVA